MSSSYMIASLLEKMTNPDADFRFMATQDLMLELCKDHSLLEDSTERKVVRQCSIRSYYYRLSKLCSYCKMSTQKYRTSLSDLFHRFSEKFNRLNVG